jgi:ATP-dependent protease ClpP protease subunit
MSLRKLPEIKALQAPKGAQWDIPSSALERWRPLAEDREATLSIYEGIGEQWDGSGMTAKRVGGILRANAGKDITVSINSPGGDFFDGIAIYNLLREHDGAVNVRVMALAASAASIIAMTGDTIQIAKAGFLMIHNAWSFVIGNRHDLKEAIGVLEPFDTAMAEVYADRSGMDVRAIAKMMDADTWINGSEALKLGFADSLLDKDTEDDLQDKRSALLRTTDIALAKQGIPRSQRREMLNELTGTPSATSRITPSADLEVLQSLSQLFKKE